MHLVLKHLIRRLLQGRRIFWQLPRGRSNTVACTFDDGPNPEFTPEVLEILGRYQARGTFFLLGDQVEKYPELATRILRRGHSIGIHGYNHQSKHLVQQVEQCRDALQQLDIHSQIIRPPYGKLSLTEAIRLARLGYCFAFWSVDMRDTLRHEGRSVPGTFQSPTLQARDIVLMHDDNPLCVAELPGILERCREAELYCDRL